jgi:hypothetical protein
MPAIAALSNTKVSMPPPYNSLCIKYAIIALYEKNKKIIEAKKIEAKYAIFGAILNLDIIINYELNKNIFNTII